MSGSSVDDQAKSSSEEEEVNAPRLPDALAVLIVEDDPPARMLMEELLPERYTVDVASTAAQAREAMDQRRYDVALIDIGLEGEQDGIKLLKTMDGKGYDDTKTIAVTAYALPGDRERILEAGFDHYVAKPFSKEHFLGAIASVLK